MITPTVGRILWYYPNAEHKFAGKQPWAAIVIYVHNEHTVDLMVFESDQAHIDDGYICNLDAQPKVPLLQDTDQPPLEGPFAEWMPYQIRQAKRHQGEQSQREAQATPPTFGCTDAVCAPYEEPTR